AGSMAYNNASLMASRLSNTKLRILANNGINTHDKLPLSPTLLQQQATRTFRKGTSETGMRARDLIIPDEEELEQIENDPHNSENCVLCQLGPKPLSVSEEENGLVHAEGMLLSDDHPINLRSIQNPHKHTERGIEGSTACFDTLYVRHRPEKGMITIAGRGSLGQGRKDELAEAEPHSPGTQRSLRAEDKSDHAIAVRFPDWPRPG